MGWKIQVLLITDDLPDLLQAQSQGMAGQFVIADAHQ
jgi:hypothetical protein